MYENKFKKNAVEFMKTNPVWAKGPKVDPTWSPRPWKTVELPLSQTTQKLALKLKTKIPAPGFSQGHGRGGYELMGRGNLTCCFLPWVNKAISYVSVPDHCNYFFTSAINGCSVFMSGHYPSIPVVWHAGIDGARLTDKKVIDTIPISWARAICRQTDKDPAPEFWRELLLHLHPELKNQHVAEVHKADYVNDGKDPEGNNTTEKSREVRNKFGNRYKVWPWGCVWGERNFNYGEWKFYLQENANVELPGSLKKTTAVVLRLSQVYPEKHVLHEITAKEISSIKAVIG